MDQSPPPFPSNFKRWQEQEGVHDLKGNHIVNYDLGLGNVTNNLAKAYSLLCVLVIAKDEGIKSLTMLGDSLSIIREVKELGNPMGRKNNSLAQSIKRLTLNFDKILFYHIKRKINSKEDYWTKVVLALR